MASDDDQESKTEEPSARRIEKARSEGNIPYSREAGATALLLGLAIYIPFETGQTSGSAVSSLVLMLARPSDFSLEGPGDALALMTWLAQIGASLALPLLSMMALAGIVSSLAQNPPRITPERLKPDPSRISLGKGLKRLFGGNSPLELLKSGVKLGTVLGAIWLYCARRQLR